MAQTAIPVKTASRLRAELAGLALHDIGVNATITPASVRVEAGEASVSVSCARIVTPDEIEGFRNAECSARATLTFGHDIGATLPVDVSSLLHLVATITAAAEGKAIGANVILEGCSEPSRCVSAR
jgi:hypothetical protein